MISEYVFPIFDGHNDTLTHIDRARDGKRRSFFVESEEGHLDLPRARRGGFAGGFFAIFAADPLHPQFMRENLVISEAGYEVRPFPPVDSGFVQRYTISMMARLFRLEEESQGQVKVVRTADELTYCLQKGVLASILHFEGAEALDLELDALEVFYQAGLRSLGLVWSRPNVFGYGVPFQFPHTPDIGPGLTAAGKRLVQECNRLGVLLDLAHLNEQGFWDVAQLSDAPLAVTHSAVHALCPSTRNLTDRQLAAIKDSEGIVGLNFNVADLREDAQRDPNTPLTVMVRHIDYLVEHLGIDSVGFGSDFDGGITLAQELGDVTGLPRLMAALQAHGYEEEALRKIAYENWVRVLRRTWHS